MAEHAGAWLLTLDNNGAYAAVGERELVHLIEEPMLLTVPTCPYYCQQVLVWNHQPLPVMNLAAWLTGQVTPIDWRLAGIIAYQYQPGADPDYGVFLLTDIPTRVSVSSENACDLPKEPERWADLAISCFQHADKPVPILDLTHIFNGGLLSVTRTSTEQPA